MVAVPYVWHDAGFPDAIPEVARNAYVIYAPSFVFRPHGREAHAPPGVMMGIFVEMSEAVHIISLQEFVEPGSFLRKES